MHQNSSEFELSREPVSLVLRVGAYRRARGFVGDV